MLSSRISKSVLQSIDYEIDRKNRFFFNKKKDRKKLINFEFVLYPTPMSHRTDFKPKIQIKN